MASDVIMPMLGMAQETGKVIRWLKQDGDAVAKGEPLLEVETDKVTVEIESPADGTLAGVRAPDGTEVPVGEVIALVLAEGEAAPPAETEPRVTRGKRRQIVVAPRSAEVVPAPAKRSASAGNILGRSAMRFVLSSIANATHTSFCPVGVTLACPSGDQFTSTQSVHGAMEKCWRKP